VAKTREDRVHTGEGDGGVRIKKFKAEKYGCFNQTGGCGSIQVIKVIDKIRHWGTKQEAHRRKGKIKRYFSKKVARRRGDDLNMSLTSAEDRDGARNRFSKKWQGNVKR